MSTATDTNGRTRKSLASQLDRMDGILDALSEGLNQAVETAVERAAGQAVRRAVVEVLAELAASPDVLAMTRPGPALYVPPASGPGLTARLKAWAAALLEKVRAGLRLARQYPGRVAAAGVGVAAAVACAAGPTLATLAKWLTALLAKLASRGGIAVRHVRPLVASGR